MITDVVLGAFAALLGPVLSFLPEGEFPIDDTAGQGFGQWIFKLDYLFPFVSPATWLLSVIGTTLIALVVYRGSLFIYNKIRG